MDFDPTAFLSMAMTEDHDTVYTAPDVPQGVSPVKIPPNTITVEGGLQMEQDMQIPIPMFGLLQQDEPMEEGAVEDQGYENGAMNNNKLDDPIHIDINEGENNTTPQPSPVERTSSPFSKKIIHVTYDETRFRKDIYCGHYERVKVFRLHCSICDKHLGCAPWFTERQMRMHKLLGVAVCRQCFEFYGDINFPTEDGSELYCCWCGEGGECFCCSTCPKIVCKRCIKRNFGPAKIKEIEANDDWSCFVCKSEDIWPHRAMIWGLQRWGRGTRQLVAMLPKEEKQAKLSKDTSHCCLKMNEEFTLVGLPPKIVLVKIPLCLIAPPYQSGVREQLQRQDMPMNSSNGIYVQNKPISHVNPGNPHQMNNIPSSCNGPPTLGHANLAMQMPQTPPLNFHTKQQVFNRMSMGMNRPVPYPMNRQMPPVLRPPCPPPPQFTQRGVPYMNQPYRILPPLNMRKPAPPSEVIDLDKETILNRALHQPLFDIAWLDKSIKEVKDTLQPTLSMLDQFGMIRNDLANDFAKVTSYSDRLSYNIKIAICNLAKANQDLVESQKRMIDNKVSTVVNSIQLNGASITFHELGKNRTGSKPSTSASERSLAITATAVNTKTLPKTPERNKSSTVNQEQVTPATPTSSGGEDIEDLAIAMLCETVLEVEDNKENKNGNRDQITPITKSKRNKGKPLSKKGGKKPPNISNTPSKIHVIDLIDDEEEEQESKLHDYLKKYKIKPCKVVLERMK